MHVLRASTILAVAFMMGAALLGQVRAEDPGPSGQSKQTTEAVINYCLNISDKAAETRAARRLAALTEMEDKIKSKISELELRRSELEKWVEQKKALQQAAEESLVEIYATMDPEEAAKQLTKLDPRLASSVLFRLKPRLASGILNEMKAEDAAGLVRLLATATPNGETVK